MPEFLQNRPGLLFVVATLLPVLSFLVLLLAFAVKTFFRKKQQSDDHEPGATIGDAPSRLPVYIATGAIALAFVFSFTGFVRYLNEFEGDEAKADKLEKQIQALRSERHHLKEAAQESEPEKNDNKISALRKEINDKEEELEAAHGKWNGHVVWTAMHYTSPAILRLQVEIKEINAKLPDGKVDAKFDKQAAKKLFATKEEKEEELAELHKYQPQGALTLGYHIDMLSAMMFVMVTFIATLIHIFSMGYMAEELRPIVADHQVHTTEGHLHRRGRFGRFFLFLSLFCFSMLNLVLADNLFQVFVSWELVGVCSYLLIGFYFERQSASNAANKAFITNRIGDAGFIIGLLIIWTYIGTFNFEDIFHRVRAPMTSAQNGRVVGATLAGQIVRADPEEPQGASHWHEILKPATAAGLETQAVLFPLQPVDQNDDLKPLKSIKVGHQTATEEIGYGLIPYWMLVAAGLGIFLGCVGKSAQFPLQVWLPDAMEGPTPVSALIHAATMVAAGVYLVGRCYPLFTSEVLLVIAYTGGITCFMAATIAVVMTDIKKVLAYSTVSQLGFMMLALGVGGWVAGLFHLITHAFFKALLFLCSGSVIYGCHHEQEMTKMGGLYPKMKTTALCMLAGVLAIAGVPMFSGWYSKDAILVQAFGFVRVHHEHFLLFLLPLVTAGMTSFYMFRMWFMTFTGKPRDAHVYEHAHESPPLMTVPLVVLAFFSITVAWGWPLHDAEASWLEHQQHHAQPLSVMADFGFHGELDIGLDPETGKIRPLWSGGPQYMALSDNVRFQAHLYHSTVGYVVLGVALLAFVLAACVYYYNLLDPADARDQFPGVYDFLTNKWYFDAAYSVFLVRPAMVVAGWCKFFDSKIIDGAVEGIAKGVVGISRGSGRFDKGIVDGLVDVIADACYGLGGWLRNVQTGYLRSYVLFLVLAAVGAWIVLSSLLGATPVVK